MSVYYPPTGFHFSLSIELPEATIQDQRFQDISGLSQEVNTEDLIEGGENRMTYKLPQRVSYQNLVLKRGMLISSGLKKWIKNAVENFVFNPVNITIHLLDEKHITNAGWYVVNAYPVKWSISNFNADDNKLVVETLELKYQYYKTIEIK
ncbi:phage tail protein [Draconibacterium sp.]|nr:phage tail protein [Draconibacterium sp.]